MILNSSTLYASVFSFSLSQVLDSIQVQKWSFACKKIQTSGWTWCEPYPSPEVKFCLKENTDLGLDLV